MSNFASYLLENCQNLDKDFLLGTNVGIKYRELIKSVNSLATYIYNNYGSDKEFLLLSENNLFFIICYLSIIKSGNIAVLVETKISDKDLMNILSQCNFSNYFVQNVFKSRFNKNILDEQTLKSIPIVENNFTINRDLEDTAIIIFTSGSTGEKKGVVLSNKNLIANTESIICYLNLTSNDRMCLVLPFFYCYGASLLHTHLRVGGSIFFSNNIFLGSVISEIDKYECTGFAGVPSTYQILINKTNFLKQGFPSLRYFTQAGGHLANKFLKMMADSFPGKQFFVMYGATEATARLSYLPPHLLKEKMGSIGKGIPGVSLEVVDSWDCPIKPGEEGEIAASGDNIMKCYYKDPDGTREVIKNGRLYTGDLATIDNDGYIFVTGRSKNILKPAGYRISPKEIEDLIMTLDYVSGCVALGLPDDILGESVVAVVQPINANVEELKDEILSLCKRLLPSYKIPATVIFMNNFPLNSSNKIDRNKILEYITSTKMDLNTYG
ncbi:AMP-binding protein [Methanosphaerula subterraneus]|uniref:AMP-binding protein n=1 Tax=Methanosphaerula subterraneus TaxID=3350244 RepID=UPI003F841153